MTDKKYYAGIGSRKTPPKVLEVMTKLARRLELANFILRSGGAIGADKAFENGVKSLMEIYYAKDSTPESEAIAATIHPAWIKCDDFAKKLHGRNIFQILGKDMKTPVEFVLCYTEKGLLKGGTRTAIILAQKHNIPVFNFGKPQEYKDFLIFFKNKYNIEL